MNDFIFSEDAHIYQLDGQVIPSVSELCSPLSKSIYQEVPKWQMEAAADRGTAVHKATQQLDAAGTADIDAEYLPYLLAYMRFLQEHSVSWSLTEQPMYHKEFLFAGTPDRYGYVDGKATLVDFKTSSNVHKPLCRAQLNFYALMIFERGLPVDQMMILHLKRDGYYKIVPFEIDTSLVMALLTIYNALKSRKKKGATKCLKK
jgi:hypothetical protein